MSKNPIIWRKNERGLWQKRDYGVNKLKNLISKITATNIIWTILIIGFFFVIIAPWLAIGSPSLTLAGVLAINGGTLLVAALIAAMARDF